MENASGEKSNKIIIVADILTVLITSIIIFGILYMAQSYNYLLFHSVVEVMGVIPSIMIFIIVLYVWEYIQKNNFISFIGIAFLFIGIIDFLHALAYSGMPIFYGFDANLPTQLWIFARYVQAFSILIGCSLITVNRPINRYIVFSVFTIVVSIGLYTIFVLKVFPNCFIEGSGLTNFKIYSEYVICIILLVSGSIIWKNKSFFDNRILYLLTTSILFQIFSELSFTYYISTYAFSNFLGHYFKLIWIVCFFSAVLTVALGSPNELLIIKMKKLVIQIEDLNADLEIQVDERTRELSETITNLKETQEQLIESEKLASIGNLVAGLAHEINTPLGIVVTTITYLQNETDETLNKFTSDSLKKSQLEKFLLVAKDCENIIYTNIARTNDLISDFKYISPKGRIDKICEIELCSYMEHIIDSITSEYEEHKIDTNLICDGEVKIQTLPLLIYQVVINLLTNSKIHGYENKSGVIDVQINKRPEYVEIVVEDYGKGIKEENIKKIFEPFFTTNRNAGTGLGLYTIYNIIKQNLKGNIICESKVDVGTKFTINIPDLLK